MAAHWLIIVHRERAELAGRLRAAFAAAFVHTVVDRRVADRRLAGGPAGPDRRRGERRQPLPPAGFRLAQRAAGYLVLESLARVAIACPDCDMPLEFEMPQFHEPPARLTAEVRHLERAPAFSSRGAYAAPAQPQHLVELMAQTSTGRPVLSCVAQARPPQAYRAPGARSPTPPDLTLGQDHDLRWR